MALVPDNVNEADSKKFEAEFEEYQKKLKKQKDEWVKENPDSVGAFFILYFMTSFSKTLKLKSCIVMKCFCRSHDFPKASFLGNCRFISDIFIHYFTLWTFLG